MFIPITVNGLPEKNSFPSNRIDLRYISSCHSGNAWMTSRACAVLGAEENGGGHIVKSSRQGKNNLSKILYILHLQVLSRSYSVVLNITASFPSCRNLTSVSFSNLLIFLSPVEGVISSQRWAPETTSTIICSKVKWHLSVVVQCKILLLEVRKRVNDIRYD